jgi:hypothetical protein
MSTPRPSSRAYQPVALDRNSQFHQLFEFIKKNQHIPAFLAKIQEGDMNLQALMKAIHDDNPDDAIFSHPDCYLYLLKLIEQESLPFLQVMTVYVNLMAFMQFTDRQPLREEDKDVRFLRKMHIEKLSHQQKLTEEGENYLKAICSNFAALQYQIDYPALVQFVLSLPPTEQWLTKVFFNRPWDGKKLDDNDCLGSILLSNIPFTIRTFLDPDPLLSGLIPSCTLIDYLLRQISHQPMQMHFCFGSINKETLRKMHSQNRHPLALYATGVKSNPRDADGYRCGPFLMWLHDMGHTFWASMLKPENREFIFTRFIPQLQTLIDEARKVNDSDVVTRLQQTMDKAADFDLTPIPRYSHPGSRFEQYIQNTFSKTANGDLYGIGRVDLAKIGCTEDRIYYLLNKLLCDPSCSRENVETLRFILSTIPTSHDYRKGRVIAALKQVADPKAKTNSSRDYHIEFPGEIEWSAWLTLLENEKDSHSLWNRILAEREDELCFLLIRYSLKFFHPYLPMTEEKLAEFKLFIQQKISASSKRQPHYFFADPKRYSSDIFTKSLLNGSFMALSRTYKSNAGKNSAAKKSESHSVAGPSQAPSAVLFPPNRATPNSPNASLVQDMQLCALM